MDIIIKEVATKKNLKEWLKFPNKLYTENDYFVPFLMSDEMETFSPDKIGRMLFAKQNCF